MAAIFTCEAAGNAQAFNAVEHQEDAQVAWNGLLTAFREVKGLVADDIEVPAVVVEKEFCRANNLVRNMFRCVTSTFALLDRSRERLLESLRLSSWCRYRRSAPSRAVPVCPVWARDLRSSPTRCARRIQRRRRRRRRRTIIVIVMIMIMVLIMAMLVMGSLSGQERRRRRRSRLPLCHPPLRPPVPSTVGATAKLEAVQLRPRRPRPPPPPGESCGWFPTRAR